MCSLEHPLPPVPRWPPLCSAKPAPRRPPTPAPQHGCAQQVFVPSRGIPFLDFKLQRWRENVPKNGGTITQARGGARRAGAVYRTAAAADWRATSVALCGAAALHCCALMLPALRSSPRRDATAPPRPATGPGRARHHPRAGGAGRHSGAAAPAAAAPEWACCGPQQQQ